MQNIIAENTQPRQNPGDSLFLSLGMIVRDEAERLPRCLESVRDLVDEVVVVDTGSHDDTVAIAANYGARVVHLDWPGDFALARNAVIDQSRGEWILMLDADEWIDHAGRQRLTAFRAEPPPPTRFHVRICNPGPDGQIEGIYFMNRLFPRRPSIRFVAPLHEFLVDVADPPTPLQTLPAFDIQHDGQQADQILARDKRRRNREILEQAIERFPDDPHCLYHLASLCLIMNEPERAWNYFDRLLTCFPQLPAQGHPFFTLAIREAMRCLERLNKPAAALALGLQAEVGAAGHPGYWLQRGRLQRRLGQFDAARESFGRCLNFKAEHLELPFNPAELNTLPLLQLLQLERALAHAPDTTPQRQAESAAACEQILLRLLQRHPKGELAGLGHNLHLLLAETLAGPDAEATYRDLLPAVAANTPAALQTCRLLGFLSGDATAFAGLLPAPQSLELPQDLPDIARQLWQAQEDFLAAGLLHLGMLYYRQPSFAVQLARQLKAIGDIGRAEQVLLEARIFFAHDAGLLAQLLEIKTFKSAGASGQTAD